MWINHVLLKAPLLKIMKRYDMGVSISEELEIDESPTGEWVRYTDVCAEIDRLRTALEQVSRIRAFPDSATNLTTIYSMREIARRGLGLSDEGP